jgi:hypothetical protein
MRWLGIVFVLALLALGWIAYDQDRGPFGLSGDMTLELVWMIMALLLVSGAGYGFQRFRGEPRAAIAGALFWAGAAVVLILFYRIFNQAS